MSARIEMTGKVYGRLTVITLSHVDARGEVRWRCVCACGATTVVPGSMLRSGHTTSCGCRMRDVVRGMKTKHGGKDTPEYEIWAGIIKRCENPSHHAWHRYGGRGISICSRWRHDFAAFVADVGPRPSAKHSIDLINNDGNYEPGNVRWATASQQARNRRPRARARGRFA